jgi:DeoR/GlpR family transcriptional regulator of sugar metabolism
LTRIRANSEAKTAIGLLAATLVSDRQTLLVNGGTTTLALARALKGKKDLTVVTNNLYLPGNISADAVSQLHILGGQFRMRSFATLGPVELPDVQGGRTHAFHADLAFLGVGGVSDEGGFTGGDIRESSVIRHMMERTERIVVLADSSKFGRTAFAHIGELSMADVLITDTAPSAKIRAALAESGVQLLIPEVAQDGAGEPEASITDSELPA